MNPTRILKNVFIAWISPFVGAFEALRLRQFRLQGNPNLNAHNQETWVFEAVPNFAFVFRYYYYLRAFFTSGEIPKVIWLNTSLFFRKNRASFKSRIMDRLTHNAYTLMKWQWIFNAFAPGEWRSFTRIKVTPEQKAKAALIFAELKSKDDLEQLVIDEYWAGDLIYDTYLRFKPAPTVDIKDVFLFELIQKSIAIIHDLEFVFNADKIQRVVVSYSTYVHHGFLVRAALKRGIKIHVIADDNQLISEPDVTFPYHTRKIHLYREWFKGCGEKITALTQGKNMLEKRLSGAVDASTSYMKQSAFLGDGSDSLKHYQLDQRPKMIFMVHDFYDSPHVFGKMLYPDFYEWVDQSLKYAKDSPFQFIVKPHPNGKEDTDKVFSELKARYPHVVFLEKRTPNALLAKLPIAAVLTVYGTAAHEFAALGHTVLCCGDNPHGVYSFSHQVKSREELKEILLGNKKIQTQINLEEIYEFMFVHNYRHLNDPRAFSVFIDEWSCFKLLAEDPHYRTELMKAEIQRINLI